MIPAQSRRRRRFWLAGMRSTFSGRPFFDTKPCAFMRLEEDWCRNLSWCGYCRYLPAGRKCGDEFGATCV